MNWKDVPHLFANGMFWFQFNNEIHQVGGYYNRALLRKGDMEAYASNDCTLIARPISDMTDEEIDSIERIIEEVEIPFQINHLGGGTGRFTQSCADLIYLLSIGVYPFDQSHFETGEVIDINTL